MRQMKLSGVDCNGNQCRVHCVDISGELNRISVSIGNTTQSITYKTSGARL